MNLAKAICFCFSFYPSVKTDGNELKLTAIIKLMLCFIFLRVL